MAIKGKRRTRHRSSRSAARAPRPFLVRPKTPLFRRTGTKVVLVVLPELGQAVAELASGEVKDPEAMTANAEGWARVAGEAGEGLGRITSEGAELAEARELMKQGLLLYSSLAQEIRVAAELEGTQQQRLADTLTEQMSVAAGIFDTGWGKLQEARREAGLETQVPLPGGLGGLPGGI